MTLLTLGYGLVNPEYCGSRTVRSARDDRPQWSVILMLVWVRAMSCRAAGASSKPDAGGGDR